MRGDNDNLNLDLNLDVDWAMGNTEKAFLELVRAGLWEDLKFKDESLKFKDFGSADWDALLLLAREQSVVGLLAAGLERVKDVQVPHGWAFQVVRKALSLEQKNRNKNVFVNELTGELEGEGIRAVMVKGQGLAQCYKRPLWRASGDIDLYLDEDDFQKAKAFFRPRVNKFDPDNDYTRHINMTYKGWVVEIHANQHSRLSARTDRVLDEVHRDIFYKGGVRIWDNGGKAVTLPSADNDAILVFTHFLHHFYNGGIGLRQICDWCRLLYTYRESLNYGLLESRIRQMGLLTEWKAFYNLACKYLGMPDLDPRFMVHDSRLDKKAERIMDFIMEVGNFGHNRDTSYYGKYPFVVRKAISFGVRMKDVLRHARIFPADSLRFMLNMMRHSFRAVSHGE